MTKSIYLHDFDGINVEFALESPERFKRVITSGGLKMEDKDGTIRSASERLDVNAILKNLVDKNLDKTIHDDSKIGHIHFYAANVDHSNAFYKQIGFSQFNYLPQFLYADLGAGGIYQHRVAMNSWHGMNRPTAPTDCAGLRHYQIVINTKDQLQQAVGKLAEYEEKDGGFWTTDPSGNRLVLTHA
jgi:catechol 2,3-dioxygenase